MKDKLALLVAEMHDGGILYSEAVREFKKSFLIHVLQQNRGNQSKASKQLGMHRNTLSRTLNELDLDVRTLRKDQGQNQDPVKERPKDTRRPPRSATASSVEKKVAR